MSDPKLDFKAGNPGAVQFGNFINYYQFHPPENRLKLFPANLWEASKVFYGLDLGCNAGDLTIELYKVLSEKISNCFMLGADIDPNLIQRATEQNPNIHNITFKCLDVMNEEHQESINNYLKKYELSKFTVVFCFSITMWIHLNFGDEGLKNFLREICRLGQFIVIEPQPWKCYKTALKRMRQSGAEFPLYKDLKMRDKVEHEIEEYLLEHCQASKIHESEESSWGRRILIFKCT